MVKSFFAERMRSRIGQFITVLQHEHADVSFYLQRKMDIIPVGEGYSDRLSENRLLSCLLKECYNLCQGELGQYKTFLVDQGKQERKSN